MISYKVVRSLTIVAIPVTFVCNLYMLKIVVDERYFKKKNISWYTK